MVTVACRTIGIALLALAGQAFGDDFQQTFEEAKTFANSRADDVSSAVKSGDTSSMPDYYQGADVPETRYADGSGDMASDAYAAMGTNDAAHTVNEGFYSRPTFEISPTDPAVQRADTIQNDPTAIFGSVNDQYTGCEVQTTNTSSEQATTETCFKWVNWVEHKCDSNLTVVCDRPVECDGGSIRLESVESDMAWGYRYPTLTIGTIDDNYWGGNCAIYDRVTRFTVENVSRISTFRLTRAAFDDWLLVKINDETVYVGPYGGDRLDVVETGFSKRVKYSERQTGNCELGTSWNQTPSIDLKPYLKNGTNSIFMRTVVGGGGEGAIQIEAKQYCDCVWRDEWNQPDCDALEAQP